MVFSLTGDKQVSSIKTCHYRSACIIFQDSGKYLKLCIFIDKNTTFSVLKEVLKSINLLESYMSSK